MAEPRYEIGKTGSVFVDAGELPVEGWSVNEETDWPETTNTGSGGFEASIPGIKKASGSFNGSFDLDDAPTGDLSSGTIVALLFKTETGTTAFTAATAGIDSFEVTSEVRGVIKWTCNWHTIGTYSWGG